MNMINVKINMRSPKPLNNTENTTPIISSKLNEPLSPIFSELEGFGIVSSFLGITLANYTKNFIPDHLYVGSYLLLAVFTFMPAIFFIFYKNNEKIKIDFNNKYNGRRMSEIIFQPRFLQAIIAAAFAYAVMSFLMTATPLSMHVMEKMSLEQTGIVLQFHLVAMLSLIHI